MQGGIAGAVNNGVAVEAGAALRGVLERQDVGEPDLESLGNRLKGGLDRAPKGGGGRRVAWAGGDNLGTLQIDCDGSVERRAASIRKGDGVECVEHLGAGDDRAGLWAAHRWSR